MRFTINTELFVKGLSIAGRAVAAKSANPILLSVKLEVSGKGLSITGTNSEISISTTIPNTVDGREVLRNTSLGTALIQARLLTDVIRRIDSAEVTVEIIDGTIAKIDDGKSSFKLFCMGGDEYPDIDFALEGRSFTIPATVLSEIVDQTAFAALSKDGKPILTTINLKGDGEHLVATATDSARLSKKVIETDAGANISCNVPAKVLAEIVKLPDPRDSVEISVDADRAVFVFGNTVVACRLIPGDYPVSANIIPTTFSYFLEVNSHEILSAIERLSVLSVGVAPVVKLSMSEKGVEVSSGYSQTGSGVERINTFQYEGERLDIAFNSTFVYEAIRALGGEDVSFSFIGEMKPFVIRNPNDESAVELITPMRTR